MFKPHNQVSVDMPTVCHVHTGGEVPCGWCWDASGHPSNHGGETSLMRDQGTSDRLRFMPIPHHGHATGMAE
jgi:hypothetical protein